MDDPRMKMITRNLTFIKDSIRDDLDTFVDGFIEEDIFDMDLKDKLDTARTSKEKADALLRMITNKGPKALNKFISLLQKKNYDQVLRKMDEAVTEGAGAAEASDMYKRDRTFTVKSPTEEEVEGAHNHRGEKSTQSLEAIERQSKSSQTQIDTQSLVELEIHRYECLQSEYNQIQITYEGARKQLSLKRDQLYKMNQEKIDISKKLESETIRNEKLENDVAKLKTKAQDLLKDLKQKEKEISEINKTMNKLEKMLKAESKKRDKMRIEEKEELHKMLKEESEGRERFEKEVLNTISQAVQDAVKLKCNPEPAKTDNSSKQRFVSGTKTNAKSSHNIFVNKNQNKK